MADNVMNQIFGSSSDEDEQFEPATVPVKRMTEVEEYGASKPQSLSKLEQFRIDFELAKNRNKSKRAKRNQASTVSYEDIKQITTAMYEAAQLDREAMTSKDGRRWRAGLAKLTMLPYILESLESESLQETFLDGGLLGAFQAWLEPHDNGAMPLYDVKYKVLMILLSLNIELDHLRECNIGKLIHFYTLNKNEHPNIRRLAQQLKDKWSKPEIDK
eukprot:NODE_386_length_8322_cov_0.935547.p5 type:complete len:216 gc:universal NODE_386_length_8322_cov_0.935547:4048-3401(-)